MLTHVHKDNIARLPVDRSASDADERDRFELSKPLPLGVCLLIWGVLAGAGWGAVYAATHFILGAGTAL
jgi:hypothetical protein